MSARKLFWLAAAMTGLLAFGCASKPDSTSAGSSDPTTRALSDPMNYAPAEDQDVTGGGLTNFDKNAFKKDMDHVLNP